MKIFKVLPYILAGLLVVGSIALASINNGGGLTSPVGVADGGTGLTTVATSNLLTGNGTSALTAESNLIFDGTNFGIGSTTPGTLLSVGNTAGWNFTTGTSSSAATGGLNLAAGCFAIGGTCLTTSGTGITSLGGLTGATQTFVNGTNVTMSSAGTAHTLGWTGDLAVADGGTGAGTFTDGGVLLGSGTGAFTAMSVLGDGEFIVGDGTTDPVAESGATLRTSIGVGTGDSPTFTLLTLSGTASSTFAGTLGVATTTNPRSHKLAIQGSAFSQEVRLATSSSFTVDWATGNQKQIGLGANTTLAFANPETGGAYRLILCQDGTGSRLVTWPAGNVLLWAGGSAPTLTTAGDACDVISFLYTTGTTTNKYFGASTLNF